MFVPSKNFNVGFLISIWIGSQVETFSDSMVTPFDFSQMCGIKQLQLWKYNYRWIVHKCIVQLTFCQEFISGYYGFQMFFFLSWNVE